jgi:hypothetical protein
MSTATLKVKVSSLAAEQRIIRNLERAKLRQLRATRGWAEKWANNEPEKLSNYQQLDRDRNDLYNHRTWLVRRAARHANLAYGFLRGRSYNQIEGSALS